MKLTNSTFAFLMFCLALTIVGQSVPASAREGLPHHHHRV